MKLRPVWNFFRLHVGEMKLTPVWDLKCNLLHDIHEALVGRSIFLFKHKMDEQLTVLSNEWCIIRRWFIIIVKRIFVFICSCNTFLYQCLQNEAINAKVTVEIKNTPYVFLTILFTISPSQEKTSFTNHQPKNSIDLAHFVHENRFIFTIFII